MTKGFILSIICFFLQLQIHTFVSLPFVIIIPVFRGTAFVICISVQFAFAGVRLKPYQTGNTFIGHKYNSMFLFDRQVMLR